MTRRLTLILRATVLVPALAAALVLGGCASGDDDSSGSGPTDTASPAASTPTTSSSSSPAAPTDRVKGVEVPVAVKDGKVSPKTRRVKVTEGTQVRLLVTSDVDDEVHVHGYDIEKELPAGQTVTVEFAADQQGLFEIETHESGLVLLQLEVR